MSRIVGPYVWGRNLFLLGEDKEGPIACPLPHLHPHPHPSHNAIHRTLSVLPHQLHQWDPFTHFHAASEIPQILLHPHFCHLVWLFRTFRLYNTHPMDGASKCLKNDSINFPYVFSSCLINLEEWNFHAAFYNP